MTRYDKTLQGQFEGMVVDGYVLVQGAVRGVRITEGSHLVVQGSIDGAIEIAAEGILTIQGTFVASNVQNEGLILASGVVTLPARSQRAKYGRVCVAAGSLINGTTVLEPDGSERPLSTMGSNVNLTLDSSAGDYCFWEPEDQRFIPTHELKPASD